MKRIDVIKQIMYGVQPEDIVITSTGMISREVYHVCDRDLNFYMQGSMGCALGIGIGIALHSKFNVHVISGDGAVLMSMGTLSLHEWLIDNKRMRNLTHWVLNNYCHATTGGQLTCAEYIPFDLSDIYLKVIDVSNEKGDAPRIPLTPKQITERFKNAVDALKKQ